MAVIKGGPCSLSWWLFIAMYYLEHSKYFRLHYPIPFVLISCKTTLIVQQAQVFFVWSEMSVMHDMYIEAIWSAWE